VVRAAGERPRPRARPRARNVPHLWPGATRWVISTRRRGLGRKPVVRGAGEGDFCRAEKRDGPRPNHDPAARSGPLLGDHRLDHDSRTEPRPGWTAADTHGCAPAADRNHRGRDGPSLLRLGPPPAQIPAGAANALGSCLGFWRRSGRWARGAGCGLGVAIAPRGGTSASRSIGCAGFGAAERSASGR
jgi:hypothetical protein